MIGLTYETILVCALSCRVGRQHHVLIHSQLCKCYYINIPGKWDSPCSGVAFFVAVFILVCDYKKNP